MSDWRPANIRNRQAQFWFLIREDQSLPVRERYHYSASGRLVRYATFEGAQRAADRLNARKS